MWTFAVSAERRYPICSPPCSLNLDSSLSFSLAVLQAPCCLCSSDLAPSAQALEVAALSALGAPPPDDSLVSHCTLPFIQVSTQMLFLREAVPDDLSTR